MTNKILEIVTEEIFILLFGERKIDFKILCNVISHFKIIMKQAGRMHTSLIHLLQSSLYLKMKRI